MPTSWDLSDCLSFCADSYADQPRDCSDVGRVTSSPLTSSLYCCNDTAGRLACCDDVTRAVAAGSSHLLPACSTTSSLTAPSTMSFWWMWVAPRPTPALNRWRTVVSGTWKYDDTRLKMSHEGAAHERLCVVCFVVWPTTIILNYQWLTVAKREWVSYAV